jgi:hypothetical protein
MTKKELKRAKRKRRLRRSKVKIAIFSLLTIGLTVVPFIVALTLPAPFHRRENIIMLFVALLMLLSIPTMIKIGKHADHYCRLKQNG